ncbi:MAG: ABC transporter substrate-binding protein [Xanthobacteraceae bacterium]
MRRREFITLLGGATAWPLTVMAQQGAMPVIGYLSGLSAKGFPSYLAAFRDGLAVAGYVEGRNVAIDYRWAEGQYDRLPAFAADLVRRQVNVIAATGVTASPLAAKAATAAIPIVFVTGGDPVKLGLVASFNRPGPNVTGVTWLNNTMAAKRLELLCEVATGGTAVSLLFNPANPNTSAETADLETAARALGYQTHVESAASDREIDAAFSGFAQARVRAVFIAGDPFLNSRNTQLVVLAARHALPTSFPTRTGVVAGGLMSYGASPPDAYRQVGLYTGRILNGERPADLPVHQLAKFELVINLKTAQALGHDLQAKLLALADEVIE